jgi:hypothetical protein
MFRFNPGKTMKLFPDKHPYMARDGSPQEVKQAQKMVESLKLSKRHVLSKGGREGV